MYLDCDAHTPTSSSYDGEVFGQPASIMLEEPAIAPLEPTERAHLRVIGRPSQGSAVPGRHAQIIVNIVSLLANDDAFETPIQPSTLVNAYKLMKRLPALVPLPRSTSADDGVIALTWRRGDDRITVTIEREGYGWTRKKNGKFTPGFDIIAGDPKTLEPIYRDLVDFYGITGTLSL